MGSGYIGVHYLSLPKQEGISQALTVGTHHERLPDPNILKPIRPC
jgi:hypothetical protein